MAISGGTPDENLDGYLPAIAAGEPTAFEAWLAGAERRIRATLRPFALQLDTEAVMQEALLRTWVAAPRFIPDGQPNGLLRLAIRIARNHAVSELRRNRLEPAEIDDLERAAAALGENAPTAPPTDPGLRAAIRYCLGELPTAPARALQARIRNEGRQRDADLAARLRMKKNTFLQNVTRARKLLAECLERRGIKLSEEMP